ncbi:MAG: hypothetical protein ABI072_11105, partial [Edaphobacter sp.]
EGFMKNKVIVAFTFLIVGALIGFVPMYSKLATAQTQVKTLNQQLDVSKRAESINSFRNRAALLYMETNQNNFTVALDMASKYFTDLRAFSDQTTDPGLKQALGSVLTSRDEIIGSLAKADPATGNQIQQLFLKLQKIN